MAIVKFPDVGQFVIGRLLKSRWAKIRKTQTKMDRGALWLKADLPEGGRASVSTSLATCWCITGTAFSVIFSE